jgi:predicted small lipoprotein YifL
MHRNPASARRRVPLLALLVLLAAALAACGSAAPSDGPAAVVNTALAKVAAKDVDGLRGLACAGQENLIRDQLGIPLGTDPAAELVPGLDTQAVIDAVQLDVSQVKLGEAAIDGDVAEVPVGGTLKVTFDKTAMRPILRKVMDQQGASMTDAQLDALLGTLAAYGQDVPLDQTVRLVLEGGAWKICQQ